MLRKCVFNSHFKAFFLLFIKFAKELGSISASHQAVTCFLIIRRCAKTSEIDQIQHRSAALSNPDQRAGTLGCRVTCQSPVHLWQVVHRLGWRVISWLQ